jgi:putative ABC transport system permease protein
MLGYYIELGIKSLRRNPILTALMVLSVGLGVGAAMTSYAVLRAASANPIPNKATRLYAVQMDIWGPEFKDIEMPDGLPSALSYVDSEALMRNHWAARQTSLYPVDLTVIPDDPTRFPEKVRGYAAYADAFPMFNVPFLRGSGWGAREDAGRDAVIVISRALSEEVFHSTNVVGRPINLEGRSYRVLGVMDRWNPQPLFFDPVNTAGFTEPVEFFVPFAHAIDLKISTAGDLRCSANPDQGWDALLRAECAWILSWVELDTRSEAAEYRLKLNNYASAQKSAGRFSWVPKVQIRNVVRWLDYQKVVPPEASLSMLVSLGFFLICLANTTGLLLAKYMRRAPEIGIRRALGASRSSIYTQFAAEAAAVGLAGGFLGVFLTVFGTIGSRLIFGEQMARLVAVDGVIVLMAVVGAIVSTVLASLYPVGRAARIQPAWHLKSS